MKVVESSQLILPAGASLAGRYEIGGVIGIGGMAVVYEALQVPLGRHVAIKVLNQRLAADDAFRRRFHREAEHAAALDHPNIVTIHDFGESEGRPYLAMRLVTGRTLADELVDGPVDSARAFEVLEDLAGALDHAHERGVLHRDVKPQNVLIDDDGVAYLADFGIAKGLGSASATVTGGIFGTIRYAAPEQVRGEPVGAAADTYALTGVAYELLASASPYLAESDARLLSAHLDDEPLPLQGGSSAAEVTRLLQWGLAKKPAERPTSLTAFVAELRETVESDRGSGTRIPTFTRARPSATALDVERWHADHSGGETTNIPYDSAWVWAEQPRSVRAKSSVRAKRFNWRLATATALALGLPGLALLTRPDAASPTRALAAGASLPVEGTAASAGGAASIWRSTLPSGASVHGNLAAFGTGSAAVALAVASERVPMFLPSAKSSRIVRVDGGTARLYDTGRDVLVVAQVDDRAVLVGCPYEGRLAARQSCARAVSGLQVRGAALRADPVLEVASRIAAALQTVSSARTRRLPSRDRDLRRARAAATAAVYRKAAASVAALAQQRSYDGDLPAVSTALAASARGYSALVRAAGHDSVARDRAARAAIQRSDRELSSALEALSHRGYSVAGRT